MNADEQRDFTEFVEACAHSLFRTAMGLTGDRQQAEDLLQTVLANAARHWDRIRRADQPAAYVRRALYHQNISWWRRLSSRRERPVPALPETADPRDQTAAVDLRLMVAAGLRRLGPRQRAVLVMRYFDDLPDAEIATILGCGPGTVKSQTRDALARLRRIAPELAEFTTAGKGGRRCLRNCARGSWCSRARCRRPASRTTCGGAAGGCAGAPGRSPPVSRWC